MNASPRKTAALTALGLGLAGGSLLAPPALAMNDLAQGYAGTASPPATQANPTPPPTDANGHAEGKCGAEHKQAEGQADHPASPTPATKASGEQATDKATQADKGMEGKCGEGKCGGSL